MFASFKEAFTADKSHKKSKKSKKSTGSSPKSSSNTASNTASKSSSNTASKSSSVSTASTASPVTSTATYKLSKVDSEKVVVTRITMCWLNIWYKKMYEKLGWMALSVTEGKSKKAKSYMHTLKELLESAEKKEMATVDIDRKEDVAIIIKKIKKLQGFAKELFKNIQAKSVHVPGEPKSRTVKELHHWHAKKYAKLAWVALQQSEGSTKEIKAYMANIADLHASVLKKLKELKDEDKIYDLKIVLENVEKLRNFANILLA